MTDLRFSIIIPVYNEEQAIADVITDLKQYLSNKFSGQYEIIAVNDGSKDRTAEILKSINGIKTINHPYNKGYGASVKTGVLASQFEWILTFDSDGQHYQVDIERMISNCLDFEMIVGARQGYQGPALRQPGKKLLLWVAQYLVEKKIPDLNSGLRLIKKCYFKKYAHLLPNGFSWTTTITLAFFKEGLNVNYIPIKIKQRQGGKSSVKPADAAKVLILILRIVMLFSPFKVFLPASAVLFLSGVLISLPELVQGNISDSLLLFFVSGLIIFFFGLIADQVAAIRREINKNG